MKEIEARAVDTVLKWTADKHVTTKPHRGRKGNQGTILVELISEALHQTRLEAYKEGQLDRYDEVILAKIRQEEFNRGLEQAAKVVESNYLNVLEPDDKNKEVICNGDMFVVNLQTKDIADQIRTLAKKEEGE